MGLKDDLIKYAALGALGYGAFLLIQRLIKPAPEPGTPGAPDYEADLGAALSKDQIIVLPTGQTYTVPYVQSQNSPITGQPQVLISKYAPFPDGSNSGVAATSLSEKEWASLNSAEKLAIEKGLIDVTKEGLLVTIPDKFLALLPGDLGLKIKSLFEQSKASTSSGQTGRTTMPAKEIYSGSSTVGELATAGLLNFTSQNLAQLGGVKSLEVSKYEMPLAGPRITETPKLEATKELIKSSTSTTKTTRSTTTPTAVKTPYVYSRSQALSFSAMNPGK